MAKARAYQKSHETFEGVVQNTYTNAEKLLAAAAELAQTGECNAEDIYSVAHELESHISSFAQRGMVNFVYISVSVELVRAIFGEFFSSNQC